MICSRNCWTTFDYAEANGLAAYSERQEVNCVLTADFATWFRAP